MKASPLGSAVPRDSSWLEQEPVVIFLTSFGRPLYLWQCLDALWRQTHFPARVILLDNAHPSLVVGDVIEAFDRRGLFSEVVRFSTNSFSNFQAAYQQRLPSLGPLHVFIESDVVIQERPGCWLAEMGRIMKANPQIGMLGSLIDGRDFVSREQALALTSGDLEAATFLAKLQSPERGFLDAPHWVDPVRDFFPTEPPCPIGNPPGRLLMLRTDAMREIGLLTDSALAEAFRLRGMRPSVTPLVRHRHLSLLNIYDYNDYSGTLRDSYFFPLAPGSIQSPPAASQLGDGIG
jgi:GT2 family glycosyltransferase